MDIQRSSIDIHVNPWMSMDYKIIHGLSMVDTWPINGDLLFHVGPFWKKWDHVPNPFEIGLGVSVLEKT